MVVRIYFFSVYTLWSASICSTWRCSWQMHIRYIVLCWSHRIIGFAFFEPVMIIRASNLTKMVLPILAKSMRHVLLLCINIWTTNVIAWSLQMTGLQNWGKLTRTLNIVRISFTAGLVLRFVVPSVYPIFGLRYYVARPGHADRSGRISVFDTWHSGRLDSLIWEKDLTVWTRARTGQCHESTPVPSIVFGTNW